MEQFLTKWLESVKANLAPRTLQGYGLNIRRHIVPKLGHLELTKLQPLHVQALYDGLLRDGLSPKTVLYVHRVLHRALKMATRWRLVALNACAAVEAPRQLPADRPTLAGHQVQALLSRIDDERLLVPVTLAVGCGLRRGEIVGLRWADLDLDLGQLQVSQTIQRLPSRGMVTLPPKTAGSRRTVQVPEGVVAVLRDWRKTQLRERLQAGPLWEDLDLVCTTPSGRPLDPDWVSKAFPRALEALGLPRVRFHDLRHTHASLLLKNGVPAKVIQQRLGHASISTTLGIYVHTDADLQRGAADTTDRILGGNLTGAGHVR